MMRYRTSRIPPYYALGKAKHRGDAESAVAFLREHGFDALRRGRTVKVESHRVFEAAAELRAHEIELDWAPAPRFQERHIEWQIVILTGLVSILACAGAFLLLRDNYWGVVCLAVAPPLYIFIFAAIHP